MITALFSHKRHHHNSSTSPTDNENESGSNTPARKKIRSSPSSGTITHQNPPPSRDDGLHKLTQHQSILKISHAHLRSATLAMHRCKTNLRSARSDYVNSQREAKKARAWNDMVEGRWGVIDCDGDDARIQCQNTDESGSSDVGGGMDAPVANAVSDESEESDVEVASIQIAQPPAAVETMNRIEITSGEEIVNGTYRQIVLSAVNRDSESMYVHNSGPFLISQPNNKKYCDVCLYRKWGYGDKMRWCIALVPVVYSDYINDVSERRWDFDRAYIYYWMEVSLFSSSEPVGDGDSILFRGEWSACHGMRPVPSVREVKQNGGWWCKLTALLSS